MLTLLVVCLMLVALLIIPLGLSFELSFQESLRGQVRIRWLFGIVRIRLFQPRKASSEDVKPVRKTHKAGRRQNEPKRRNFGAVVRQDAFRQRIYKFVRDLWRMLHRKNLKLHTRIGLGDPADTGQLWAFVGPICALFANIREATIDVEADFDEPVFEFEGSGTIEFIPLQMIYLTLGMLLSPPVWKGLRQINAG